MDSNNHIHIAWCDYTPGNYEIYCKKSTDEGASWKTKRLTWTSGSSGYPAITVDASNTIHVVYGDYAIGYHELYCKRSTDGGISWTTKRLTWNVGGSYFPSVAVDPNNRIHVTWTDSTPGKNEIYYMRSTNGGMSWKTKRLTQTSGYSWNPDIAVDSNNNIHVIWYDDSSGNNEIYYKKGIQ